MKRKKRVRILIIYYQDKSEMRQTLCDSIFCFSRYQSNADVFYYNYEPKKEINKLIEIFHFDCIVFHSTFMNLRWFMPKVAWKSIINNFKNFNKTAIKGVFVQDEQYMNDRVCDFINAVGIDILFTVGNQESTKILYPENKVKIGEIQYVLTGYIDEKLIKKVKNIKNTEKENRTIDIGYRTDMVPYSSGKQGRLKIELVEVFHHVLQDRKDIVHDICNTVGNKNVLFGLDWIRFLLKCRTIVGCMGGADILDRKGDIRRKVEVYMKRYPNTTYEEIKKQILIPYATKINYIAISPRCFESAITKTCQVLVEDDYAGILKPDIHYIAIKRDFSNMESVIDKIMDKKLCEKLVNNTYRDLVLSGKYTYRKYVSFVLDTLTNKMRTKSKNNCFTNCFLKIILLFYNKYIQLMKYV